MTMRDVFFASCRVECMYVVENINGNAIELFFALLLVRVIALTVQLDHHVV